MNEFEYERTDNINNGEPVEDIRDEAKAAGDLAREAQAAAKEAPAAFEETSAADPAKAAREAPAWQRPFERGYARADEDAPREAGARREGIPMTGEARTDTPYRPAGPERRYTENVYSAPQPDYRSAYGVRYDPYDGQRTDPREARGADQYYAFDPHNRYVHTYVNDGNGASYYRHEEKPAHTKKAKEKKDKKYVSRSALGWMIAICILFSAAFGAGGIYLGSRLVKSSDTATKEYGTVNYQIGENTVSADGSIAAAAAKAADTVVEITTEQKVTSSFFGQYVQSGAGSGVIISEDGRIITCAHVVENATSITVRLTNGDSFSAKLLGSDSRTDIAVIKIDATGLPAAGIGDSDKVVVGQTAIAIGNPLGTLGGTVSCGIISSLNREIKIDGQSYTLLQLDASINPGNSGGGLFDINGNLIGIVNAKSSGSAMSSTTIEGLGFAIPINQAIEVASQLSEKGYVGGRVNLGIYVVEVNSSTNTTDLYNNGYSELLNYITEYGVYFVRYQAGQNGDFKYGDRIIAVDGTSVSTRSEVQEVLQSHSIGDTVTVTVSRMNADMRRAQIVEVTVNLVEYIPETASSDSN